MQDVDEKEEKENCKDKLQRPRFQDHSEVETTKSVKARKC